MLPLVGVLVFSVVGLVAMLGWTHMRGVQEEKATKDLTARRCAVLEQQLEALSGRYRFERQASSVDGEMSIGVGDDGTLVVLSGAWHDDRDPSIDDVRAQTLEASEILDARIVSTSYTHVTKGAKVVEPLARSVDLQILTRDADLPVVTLGFLAADVKLNGKKHRLAVRMAATMEAAVRAGMPTGGQALSRPAPRPAPAPAQTRAKPANVRPAAPRANVVTPAAPAKAPVSSTPAPVAWDARPDAAYEDEEAPTNGSDSLAEVARRERARAEADRLLRMRDSSLEEIIAKRQQRGDPTSV